MPNSVSARLRRRGPVLLAILSLVGLMVPAGAFAAKPGSPPVTFQILNTSDHHGQIDPMGTAVPPVIGGGWSISARWTEERTVRPTLTVAAGDDFGATPPIASFFNEEPAVIAERMMGIQVGTFGNHNFDKGIEHLQSMIDLAAAPTDADHPGAPFRYVAANLENIGANLTGVEPFAMFNVGGAKVAVIGIVNEEGPTLVTPGNYGTMIPSDGIAAANKWAAKAKKAGANTVVVITHKGVRGFDELNNPFGELIDFAGGVDSNLVDVVIGDHTDVQWGGVINGVVVHENRSKGNTYTRTVVEAQPGKGGGTIGTPEVTFVSTTAPGRTATQLKNAECPDPNAGGVSKYCDQAMLTWLAPIRVELAVFLDPKIANVAAVFPRGGNVERRQENALGSQVAEGMKWYQGTDFALISGGGIRTPLLSSYAPLDVNLDRSLGALVSDNNPADMVIGDVYSVLPFGNTVLKRTITGAQLWEALENGVSRIGADGTTTDGRLAQVAGFRYTFNYDNPSGCSGTSGAANWVCIPSRITSVTFPNGDPIAANDTVYTIALPSFTNQGGDSYRVFLNNFQKGENEVLDATVWLAYIAHLGNGGYATLTPTIDGRVTKCGVNNPCP